MAFDTMGENDLSIDKTQLSANQFKINRKYGVRDRFLVNNSSSSYLKSTISTPISLQINHNLSSCHTVASSNACPQPAVVGAPNTLNTISSHVDCYQPSQGAATAAIIAIDLMNKRKLKCCASQPACLSIGSGNGFLVNTGHNISISGSSSGERFTNPVAAPTGTSIVTEEANSSKACLDTDLDVLNDMSSVGNSSIRVDDEIPPPYEMIVNESMV
jgi:hypothetical protein